MKTIEQNQSNRKVPQLHLNFHQPPLSNDTFAQSDSRQQFSFNRQIRSRDDSLFGSLKQKYSDIYNDLKIMNISDIIELLLEELDQSQKCKKQVWKYKSKVQTLQEQLTQSRQTLKKKRQAIALLCQTQSKNLQLIQKLENKLCKKNQYGRDTHYQKKYQQLSVYMNQYIRNINQAQQQFKKAYSTQKNQNLRLTQQTQNLSSQYAQLYKRYQVLSKKIKRYEHQINQLNQSKSKLNSSINLLMEQNQILKKQIQIFQENIRITDRLEVHLEKQHHQLSSQLDFIRQKICQNQSISKDIIQKLEESSSNCQKVNKDKQKYFSSLQRNKDKNSQLQKQLTKLHNKNQQLEQNLKILKKQYQLVTNQRDQLDDDLMNEKLQKQSIRKQLLLLADKVRLMQSTYRKQIEQSQKIKGQLYKFWQNKQKKQSAVREIHSTKILGEIKINTNDNSQSHTTLSISQKQSKMSLWHKKSDQENSIIIHQISKQNQSQNQSQNQNQNYNYKQNSFRNRRINENNKQNLYAQHQDSLCQ